LLGYQAHVLEQRKRTLRGSPPMKPAVLEIRIHPLSIAAGKEKVAVLQAATDENNFVQNEALIG
jgi:hypothetical protein